MNERKRVLLAGLDERTSSLVENVLDSEKYEVIEDEGLDPVLDSELPPSLVIWRWSVLYEGEFRALADLLSKESQLLLIHAPDEKKKAKSCAKAWPGFAERIEAPVDFGDLCGKLAKILDDEYPPCNTTDPSHEESAPGDEDMPPVADLSPDDEDAMDDFEDPERTVVTGSPQRLARENARLKGQIEQLKERIEASLVRQKELVHNLKAAESSGMDKEIERHVLENQRIKERMRTLENRLDTSDDDRREAVKELSQIRAGRKELNHRVEELERENAELNESLAESSVRLDSADDQAGRVAELEDQREELGREVKHLRGLSENLRREVEQVSESKTTLIIDLEQSRQELARVSEERGELAEASRQHEAILGERSALINQLNAALSKTVGTADGLQARVTEIEKDLAAREADAARMSTEVLDLRREADRLAAERDSHKQGLTEATVEIEDLQAALETTANLQTEFSTAKTRIVELETDMAAAEKAASDNARQLTERLNILENDRAELDQLLAETEAEWKQEKENLVQAREEAEAEHLALTGALETLRNEAEESRARIGQVQAELGEAQRHAEEAEAALDGVRETLATAAEERESLAEERDSLAKEQGAQVAAREALTAERDSLTGRVDELLSDLQAAEELNAELEVEGNEAQARVKDLEAIVSEKDASAEGLEQKAAELGSRVSDLEALIVAKDEAAETQEQRAEELTARISELDASMVAKDEAAGALEQKAEELTALVSEFDASMVAKDEAAAILEQKAEELTARISELDASMVAKDEAAEALEQKAGELTAQISELESTVLEDAEAADASSAQIIELESTIRQNAEAAEASSAQITELESTIRQNAESADASSARVTELESSIREKAEATDAAEALITEFQSKMREDAETAGVSSAYISELEATVRENAEADARLTKTISELEEALTARTELADALEVRSTELHESLAEQDVRAQELEAALTEKVEALERAAARAGELGTAVSSRDTRVQELEAAAPKRDARIRKIEDELKKKAGLLVELQAALDEKGVRVVELEGRVADQEQHSSQAAEMEGLRAEAQGYRDGHYQALELLEDKDQRIETLETALRDLKEQVSAINEGEEYEILASTEDTGEFEGPPPMDDLPEDGLAGPSFHDLEELNTRVAELQAELDVRAERLRKLERVAEEKEQLLKMVDDLSRDLESLREAGVETADASELERLRRQRDDLEEALGRLRDDVKESSQSGLEQLESLRRDRETLSSKVESLAEDLSQKSDLLGVYEEEIEDVRGMQRQVKELTGEKGGLKKAIKDARDQILDERRLFTELEDNYRTTIMGLNNEKEDALIRLSELEENARRLATAQEANRKTIAGLITLVNSWRTSHDELGKLMQGIVDTD